MSSMLERRIAKAQAMYSKGYTISKISEIMLLDESTIRKYITYEKENKPNFIPVIFDKIEMQIYPIRLNQKQKDDVKILTSRFDKEILIQSAEIGAKYYLRKNSNIITQEEVNLFLEKLPGIAYNLTKNTRENNSK